MLIALRLYIILMFDLIWIIARKHRTHILESIQKALKEKEIQRRVTKLVHWFNVMPYKQRILIESLWDLDFAGCHCL